MNSNIENFFKEYATNYAKQSVVGISSMCSFPFSFYTQTGISVIVDEPEFAKNSGLLLELYAKLGMESSSPEVISIIDINAVIKLVEIKWHFFEAEKEIVSFFTQYILGESNGKLKMLGVFQVDEHAQVGKLEALKKAKE